MGTLRIREKIISIEMGCFVTLYIFLILNRFSKVSNRNYNYATLNLFQFVSSSSINIYSLIPGI